MVTTRAQALRALCVRNINLIDYNIERGVATLREQGARHLSQAISLRVEFQQPPQEADQILSRKFNRGVDGLGSETHDELVVADGHVNTAKELYANDSDFRTIAVELEAAHARILRAFEILEANEELLEEVDDDLETIHVAQEIFAGV